MADNRDRTEQRFQQAQETMGTVFENNRRSFQSFCDLQRNSFTTFLELNRKMQEDYFKLANTWFEQTNVFQKTCLKNIQDASNRVQEIAERASKENQDRFYECVDQGIELMSAAGKQRRG